MNGETVVAAARRYLGVPFHHAGRVQAGLDCAGLIIRVGKDLGLLPPGWDFTRYGREPDGSTMRALCDDLLVSAPAGEERTGDVLLFRIRVHPQHLAIRTDRGMIHAHSSARRVVETGIDPLWQQRLLAAYRFPGIGE